MKKVFDNPELSDKLFDAMFKSFDLVDDDLNKNKKF